jgi:nuclear pore complex protein Nup155
LTRDEQQIPDPWDLLNSSYSRDYLPPGSAGETRLQIRQIHVIPDILMAQFEGRECRCFMGLFAQIGRAWMTVDNRLFLWDFATGYAFLVAD